MFNSTGSKFTVGSTGAKASIIKSLISAPDGSVHTAPESLFGESLPECGLLPLKESLAPKIPRPLQSNKLTPTSLAVIIGSSIIKPSLPLTRTSIVTLDNNAPGANSRPQLADA